VSTTLVVEAVSDTELVGVRVACTSSFLQADRLMAASATTPAAVWVIQVFME
jgi:hypothetical protein